MGVYECNRDVTPRIRQAYVPRTAVTPDFLPLAIAQGGCSQAHVFLQPLNCALRTIGLNEIDGDAEYDDDKDELRFDPLAQKGGNHAGDKKNDDQRIQEQVQHSNAKAPRRVEEIVGAELGEARLGFLRCQPHQSG